GRAGTEVLLQFHHCCCDGVGAVRLIETLMTAYAAPAEPGVAGPDTRLYRARSRCPLGAWESARTAPNDLWRISQFLRTNVRPLAGSRFPGAADSRGLPPPDLISHTLEVPESEHVCSLARRANATVNDLLLRDLFVTLDSWDRTGPPGSPS